MDKVLRVRHTARYDLRMANTELDQDPMIKSGLLTILPKDTPPYSLVFTTGQLALLLDVSDATIRGWLSRKQFPQRDGEINGKTPYWRVTTILEYVRNAPGGRLGYPVG